MHITKYGAPRPVRKMAPFGHGSIKRGYKVFHLKGHPNAQPSNGLIFEHRYVMAEHLGRPLLPHESPHHINGDRLDNRIENLELWSVSQPRGQRVVDKLAWCREFLAQYEASPIDARPEDDAHYW